jgi:MoxR-like ATPase
MPLTALEVQAQSRRIIDNLETVIVGKRRELERMLIGLLCQGHVLIEDVPGVGKTILARSLAQSLGCTFSRIQFTPDLLPSDITGSSIFNQQTRQFEFRPGPIIGQIVLADEINRATPKTQSALLEAMEERQITIDGVVHALPQPFMVIGTQNPIEYEGTFPLPEAQLDRFLLRVSLGYLSKREEIRMIQDQQFTHPIQSLNAVVSTEELLALQEAVKHVFVSEASSNTSLISHLPPARMTVYIWDRARAVVWDCFAPGRHTPPCKVEITCCPTTSRYWRKQCSRIASW